MMQEDENSYGKIQNMRVFEESYLSNYVGESGVYLRNEIYTLSWRGNKQFIYLPETIEKNDRWTYSRGLETLKDLREGIDLKKIN